jgi:N-terminal 7TM region of histidine kinase
MLFEIMVSVLCILLFVNMGIFAYLWGRRPLMIKAGLVMLPATSIACLVGVIQLYTLDLEGKVILYSVSALLFVVIFTSFLIMVLEITQRYDPSKPNVFIPLIVVPAIAIFAIITDPWLHLFDQSESIAASQALQEPILLVAPSVLGFLWVAYFDVVGTIFALSLFVFIYRDSSKGWRLFFLAASCSSTHISSRRIIFRISMLYTQIISAMPWPRP